MDKSIGRKVVNGLSAMPIIWVGILYLFTALCSLELGHLPVPSLNDPKGFGYEPLYYLSVIGMLSVVVLVFAWLVLLPLTIQQKFLSKKGVIIMVVGSTIALIQLFADPFNLIDWLLD